MKTTTVHHQLPPPLFSYFAFCSILTLFLVVGAGCFPVFAQGVVNKIPADWPDSFKQKAANLDLSVIETGIFLNGGMLTQQDVELGRKTAATTTTKLSPSDAKSWLRLYKRFRMVDMRGNRMADIANLMTENYEQQTMSNVVPIGIMDVEGDWFTDAQLDDNVKQKKANKKPTNPKGEKLAFRMASALYTDFFEGSVIFDFSPSRYQSSTGVPIKEISIDLLDGKGHRSIMPNKSTQINHRYTTPGKKAFLLRIKTNKNTFESVSEINIKTVERPKIDQILRVEAERVIRTQVAGGRVGISGADLFVQLGCDGIFDRPILIIEGFDPFNSNGINWIRDRYNTGEFNLIRQRGYDLVFLNYWDGTDWIQNNANVVRNAITLINNVKANRAAENKLIVIGESMGGIVARYAIRRMEQDGHNPEVSHYISFDAPHKGANIPFGIQTLAIEAATNAGVQIASLFSSDLRELFALVDVNATPAARQLVRERVLLWPYSTSVNVYQTNEFLSLQNELQQMGYPSTCRNLAVICGSISNARQRYGVWREGPDEQPGDHIVRMYTWFYGYHAKTINRDPDGEDPNRPTDISRLYGWGDHWRYHSSNRNYDINAGGVEPAIRDQDGIRFNASFVPTYSAMDWQGDLNAGFQAVSPNQSPFHAVYGNNDNNDHISVNQTWDAWQGIFQNEIVFGQLFTGACNNATTVLPPSVNIRTEGPWCSPTLFEAEPYSIQGIDIQYEWSVREITNEGLGPVVATGSGSYFSSPSWLPAGMYFVTCSAFYPARPDVRGNTTTVVGINNCNGGGRVGQIEPLPEEQMTVAPNPTDGPLIVTLPIGQTVMAQLTISDVQGRNVLQKQLFGPGPHSLTVPPSTGLYILRAVAGGEQWYTKLIVQH
jgi:hypothetical protein